MFNSLLAFFFWKACTFSNFQRFLCWKSRNYSQQFSLEIFFWDLSSIIDYWGSIFTLYLTWGAFSLVCVVSVIFFFLSFFFFFYWYFPWQALAIHRIAGKAEGIIVFFVFHFHPLMNIPFSSSRFLPLLCDQSICNYQTNSWNLFSLEIYILFAFSSLQLSRSYWLWHFKVTLWGFEIISNYHPSITKRRHL